LLKLLWWQAPTLLNPHFGVGQKDQDASRIFYEPLAAWDPDGNLVPMLAAEIPSVQNGGVARDGLSVVWKLKRNVTWHDGRPFTADDVIFNWEFAVDPATAAVSVGIYKDVSKAEKIDAHTVRIVFAEPTPFGARPFVGGFGLLIPKHLFEPYRGAKSREAPANLKPVGTGPYRFVEFKPGDIVSRRSQPQLPRTEPTALRCDRDERRRRCGLGGAHRAADRRVRLCVERAGRGRTPEAP
jgi:peptide/nickel transport system substrate-binding protein